jgi:hypothetical protein
MVGGWEKYLKQGVLATKGPFNSFLSCQKYKQSDKFQSVERCPPPSMEIMYE